MPPVALLLLLLTAPALGGHLQPSREDHATLAAFAQLRDPGIVGLMRHARAPGVGDPGSFTPGDCSTQRLLSDEGRTQARAIGEVLRRTGVTRAAVYSSAWCRCLETATLLDIGEVATRDFLNSFFRDQNGAATATVALRRAVLEKTSPRLPTLMVTHQVNITALTGLVPAEGEIVFVRGTAAGDVVVVGRARLRD